MKKVTLDMRGNRKVVMLMLKREHVMLDMNGERKWRCKGKIREGGRSRRQRGLRGTSKTSQPKRVKV